MAIFSRVEFLPGYPRKHNVNRIEISIIRTMIFPHVSIMDIDRYWKTFHNITRPVPAS